MKVLKIALAIIAVSTSLNVNSQSSNDLKVERQKNKVELFSQEERNELHFWFYNKIESIQMTQEEGSFYDSILVLYIGKMARLDDKDRDNTQSEIIKLIEINIEKINFHVKPILNAEQYTIHLEMMDVLFKTVELKLLTKS